MKRLGVAFASIGALAMLLSQVITPAVATHVNEPTAPINRVDLRVLHYSSPRVDAPCDGGEFPFQNTRIELYIEGAARPSEHFDATIRVVKLVGTSGDIQRQWSVQWLHSNVPPHNPVTPWRSVGDHTNTWIRNAGKYYVEAEVEGLESGQHFVERCTFTVPADATP